MKILLLMLVASMVHAAPKAKLWDRWEAYNPASSVVVDHSQFGEFLKAYVVEDTQGGPNRVRYAAVTPSDKASLKEYIDYLEDIPVSALNRPEQFAYWVNMYNAVTVDLILDRYPVESIRDIKLGGLFSSGPWDKELVEVEGEKISLNDIEHRILRPIWQDNRVHYAVNCASYSCPNLQLVPFTADSTEQMLESAAREYINSDRGVGIEGSRLYLSSIFDWYQSDFGGNENGVIKHLLEYADQERTRIIGENSGSIKYRYDWSLNE